VNSIKSKIYSLQDKLSESGFQDRRFLSLVVLAVIGLAVLWNGTRVVQQNYTLLRKISILEDENTILELENRNKQIQVEYYKTPEFAELQARKNNGKAAPGERVFIVTNEAGLASLKTPENIETTKPESDETMKPLFQRNFEAWMNFFFGGNTEG
jgi:cell division protein FtsB